MTADALNENAGAAVVDAVVEAFEAAVDAPPKENPPAAGDSLLLSADLTAAAAPPKLNPPPKTVDVVLFSSVAATGFESAFADPKLKAPDAVAVVVGVAVKAADAATAVLAAAFAAGIPNSGVEDLEGGFEEEFPLTRVETCFGVEGGTEPKEKAGAPDAGIVVVVDGVIVDGGLNISEAAVVVAAVVAVVDENVTGAEVTED